MSITVQSNKVILSGRELFWYKPLALPSAIFKKRKIYLSPKETRAYINKHPKGWLTKRLQSMSIRPTLKLSVSEKNFQEWQAQDPEFPWEATKVLRMFLNDFTSKLNNRKLSLKRVARELKLFNMLINNLENEVRGMKDVYSRKTGYQVVEVLRGNLTETTQKMVTHVNALSSGYRGSKSAINSTLFDDIVKLCDPERAIGQLKHFMNQKEIVKFQSSPDSDPAYKENMMQRWVIDYESVCRYRTLAETLIENPNQEISATGQDWLRKTERAIQLAHNELLTKVVPNELEGMKNRPINEYLFRTNEDGSLNIDFNDKKGLERYFAELSAEKNKGRPIQAKLLYQSLIKWCEGLGYEDGEFIKSLKKWNDEAVVSEMDQNNNKLHK